MIIPIEEKHLKDIASLQLLAWQKGFKGILSEKLLNELDENEFLNSWQQIILDKKRVNYTSLTNERKPTGFVSFGPYKKIKNSEFAEIYGIYINPQYWRQGYAKALMERAVSELEDSKKYSVIFLWTMVQNVSAKKFYENFGFELDGRFRNSERNGEAFEECRYAYPIQS